MIHFHFGISRSFSWKVVSYSSKRLEYDPQIIFIIYYLSPIISNGRNLMKNEHFERSVKALDNTVTKKFWIDD